MGGGCKVSIITVSYNSANTIEQTIKSVLQQTYHNIEYIMIDGLSTDKTQQIIEKYRDAITYFVSEKDGGLYEAMNKGIQKATGDLIGIINSDDWYALDAVENVVEYFEKNEVELVYGKTEVIAENGEKRVIGASASLSNIWWEMPFMHASVFIRRSVYKQYGMFDLKYKLASDCDLLLRLYTKNVKFGYIDKIIAYFREGGLSTRKHMQSLDEAYAVSQKYAEYAPDKETVLQKIKTNYIWNCFYVETVEVKLGLRNLLCKYFDRDIRNVVIFGTGLWGERCYKALADTDITILYFTDNNSSKWNTDFNGMEVVAPDTLRETEAWVLIAVANGCDTIERQLESMHNHGLHSVSVKALAEFLYREKSK